MGRYVVRHSYTSYRDGQLFGPWAAGDTIELSEADAEWVNRDSPACLAAPGKPEPVKPEPAERQKPPAKDRQHRGAANRGAS